MAFSLKRVLTLVSAISLAACMTLGCDDNDSDGDAGNTGNTGNTGNNGGGAVTPSGATDWTKTGKSDIVSYLVSIGKLDAKYNDPAFLDTPKEKQIVGASCFCYGPRCNYAGYERPELQLEQADVKTSDGKSTKVQAAQIFGCDGVAADSADGLFNGAVRACFRSSNVPNIKPAIFFPYGTCALAMSKCTPDTVCPPNDSQCKSEADAVELNNKTICGFAKFGDYENNIDKFVACPDNSVLIDFVMNIELSTLGRKARLDVRACFPGCKTDEDCHGYNTYDPITNEQSQMKCEVTEAAPDGSVAKVCFDKRTVAKENGGEGIFKLVNAGDWAITK